MGDVATGPREHRKVEHKLMVWDLNAEDTCTDRPAMSTLRIACGIEKPSYTGTAWVTPSPESSTIPVVRPDEYLIAKAQVSSRTHA
jgi:hypothetical protein